VSAGDAFKSSGAPDAAELKRLAKLAFRMRADSKRRGASFRPYSTLGRRERALWGRSEAALAKLARIIRESRAAAKESTGADSLPSLGIFRRFASTAVPPSIERKTLKLLASFDDYSEISGFRYGVDAPADGPWNPAAAPFVENALADIAGLRAGEARGGGVSSLRAYRSGMKRLSYVESRSKGLDRALALAAIGWATRSAGLADYDPVKLRAAEARLEEALKYGSDWFKPTKTSKIAEPTRPPGAKLWDALRKRIESTLLDLKFDLLAAEYGRGYADYVAMRSRFEREEWWLAYPLAEKLAAEAPRSQLGEAGGFYACRMLLVNDSAGEWRDKSAPNGVASIKAFIESKPYGLYRGEAMMELGKYFLECEWDADEAAVWYEKALKWFREVRGRADAVDLYALSKKLSDVAAVRGPATSLDQWRMTKHRKIDPKEVVNRKTAPWYLSENERECLFHCGFLRYVDGDYDGAKKLFEQVREVDANIAKLVGLNWPNAYWRLISACNVKRMIFPGKDRKNLKGKNKLRCAYAELNYLCEKFEDAKRLFIEMRDDPKSSKTEKAMALIGIGQAGCFLGDSIQVVSNNINSLKKAIKLAKKNSVADTARFLLGRAYLGVAWKERDKKAIANFEAYLKRRPNGVFAPEAQFERIDLYIDIGLVSKAKRLFEKVPFFRKHPESGFTKALKKRFAEIANRNTGG
jgi:tetratricopeptide (TPR) repeat protein